MTFRQAKTCDIAAALMIAALTVFRLWYGGTHGLISDEAYYWQWSRHLDYGYYDNTPLLAYVIHFFVAIFGVNEFGVRFGAVSSVAVMSAFVYLLARRLFTPQTALVSLVLLNVTPLAADASFLMTQDPVQLMFWAVTVYVVWLAVEPTASDETDAQTGLPLDSSRRAWLWILAGVLAGLTIMAKLNGLVILAAIFAYVALAKSARPWLRHPAPYVAGVIALAIFAPFLWWNHTHGNAYWRHGHAMGTRGTDKPGYPILDLLDFLGAQAIVVSPFLYLTYLYMLSRIKHDATGENRDKWLFLWCASASVTIVTAFVSLHNKVEGNWAVDAYFTGIIMLAVAVGKSWQVAKTKAWHIAAIAFGVLISVSGYIMPSLVAALHIKDGTKLDRSLEMYGWHDLATRVEAEQNAVGGPSNSFVFGTNYRIPSQLAFYMHGQPTTYSLALHERANNYMFWDNVNKHIGQNAIFVNDSDQLDDLPECRAVFTQVTVEPPVEIMRPPYSKPIRTLQIYRCYGFKGYDIKQWQQGW